MNEEYLQGKIAFLDLICRTLIEEFFARQTDVADNAELRMITAANFRKVSDEFIATQNIWETPFGRGFSEAADELIDKMFNP